MIPPRRVGPPPPQYPRARTGALQPNTACALHASGSDGVRRALFPVLDAFARASNLRSLAARVLAAMCAATPPHSARVRASLFSSAVSTLDRIGIQHAGTRTGLSDEVRLAAQDLSAASGLPLPRKLGLLDLHAVAHKALVDQGSTVVPDQRLALALRRVLEASAAMRSGGGLKQLLDGLTGHMTEIMGAQRACVVLVDESQSLALGASSWAASAGEQVSLSDLSHTVIEKVRSTRRPVNLSPASDGLDSSSVQGLSPNELAGAHSIMLLRQSILCVPMLRNDVMYGVLYVDTDRAIAFDRIDLEVLSLFAEQAAAALESTRLLENIQASFLELKTLQDRLVRGERLRVIGEISSGVAHEFNNLLTSILARVQMMSLGSLAGQAQADLALIERAALDAAEVVRRLQTFSRNQRQHDFRVLNMEDVCRDAIDLLRPLWRGGRGGSEQTAVVQLRCETQLQVRGDPTELREVMTNLLKNALEAIEVGGRIGVTAARRGGRVQVTVRDNGCGIAVQLRERVFDPFFTTKGERGTGLGLCLCQQIVEKHGGRISLACPPGKGTVVTFSLPAAQRATAGRGDDVPAPRKDRPGSGTVLVVDDDASVLDPVCSYLERRNFRVIRATSGEEALRIARAERPDVVLSDVGMPGMSGIELCSQLRALHPNLPVVLMSGWASDVDPNRALAAGAAEVLAKPFPMERASQLLARFVSAGAE